MDLAVQRSLFGNVEPAFDASYARLERTWLDGSAWVDHQPEWVAGAELLFDRIIAARPWGQRSREVYERVHAEPRLTAPWTLRSGALLDPPLLEAIRHALSARYGVRFDSVGFNLYRDGRDSVAWHRDQISHLVAEPVVALVSLGERRSFLMRPRGGGRSRSWRLGGGDLLVTGGAAQRTWEHAVPKAAQAGPRISLAYRHGPPQEP